MNPNHIPMATVVGVTCLPPPPSAPGAYAPSAAPADWKNLQNEGGAREFLEQHHWPVPLQDAFLQSVARVPMRFFICDDSGSMQASDGCRIVQIGDKSKFVECSRWAELTSALHFHLDLAHAGMIPTEFRLLNGVQPLRVGFQEGESAANVRALKTCFNDSPNGGTPLCRHIHDVVQQIHVMEPMLRAMGQKVCIIIATDGESSDGDVAEALRPLKDMPAWVCVRLCTDSEAVVKYWNDIDNVLEQNLDILDDLAGEAEEVHKVNPWITYTEQLHRFREFGVSLKEFDLLDEGTLSKEHLTKICRIIYGKQVDGITPPEVDMKAFISGIDALNTSTARVWDPVTELPRHWVDTKALKKTYRVGGGCAIM